MEEKMVLKTEIKRFSHDDPLSGTCSWETARDIPFVHFLGFELLARTQDTQLLGIAKDVFALFTQTENDKGAVDALGAVKRYCIPTTKSYPLERKLSVEAFRALQRTEEKKFFEWLETAFWAIHFYRPDSWECKTSGDGGYTTRAALKKTRSMMVAEAATIWSGKSDELALSAFTFLCDCCDTYRFKEKAKTTMKALDAYKKQYYPSSWDSFSVPHEDVKMVVGHMQTALPRELKTIQAWGVRARELHAPKPVHDLFAHAFVTAGGTVFK